MTRTCGFYNLDFNTPSGRYSQPSSQIATRDDYQDLRRIYRARSRFFFYVYAKPIRDSINVSVIGDRLRDVQNIRVAKSGHSKRIHIFSAHRARIAREFLSVPQHLYPGRI